MNAAPLALNGGDACLWSLARSSEPVRWRTRNLISRSDRIANVAHGVNQRGIADLFSEPADENFDQLCIVLMRVFPNSLAQLRARKNAARLPHQDLEQHQLPRRKFDAFRATVNIVSSQVEREITNAQRHHRFLWVTAPEGAHARQQFLHCKRLRQIIVSSKLQPGYSIIYGAARGEQQYTACEVLLAKALQHLEAIDPGQADIEHDEVERRLSHLFQGGFAIVNCFRIVAGLGQRRSDLPRHSDFIFDDQDAHGLETDGKLCGKQMIVLARTSRFMLKAILQF